MASDEIFVSVLAIDILKLNVQRSSYSCNCIQGKIKKESSFGVVSNFNK